MPQSNPIKSRARASTKKLPRVAARSRKSPATKIPKGIILKKSDDVIAKLRALEKIGAYRPRKGTTRKTITRSQRARVLHKWEDIKKHGKLVHTKHGTVTQRPFKRTMKGYVLNDGFSFQQGKVARSQPGIIKTRTGAIIDRAPRAKVTLKKDGTIVTHETRYGKRRTVYTGSLTMKQTIAFLDQVEDGTFKFPKGMMLRITMFDNPVLAGATFRNVRQLAKFFFDAYGQRLQTYVKKHPNALSPLTLEFMTL